MAPSIAPRAALEQRRSPRFTAQLDVDLADRGATKRMRTADVSRHGLFIATDTPPPERQLLQLTIQLRDGPLPATAFVVRRITAASAQIKGMGVQFFALSAEAKARWDEYVYSLAGEAIAKPSDRRQLARSGPDGATFLVKRKDLKRLIEFLETALAQGTLYITTPVLKETGAQVALIIVHPDTQDEHILWATVQRVCRQIPKGMEVKINPLTVDEAKDFRRFVETGHSAPKVDVAAVQRTEPRAEPALAAVPEISEQQTGSISIDITVDDAAVEASATFEWSDVYDSGLMIDFALEGPASPNREDSGLLPSLELPIAVQLRCEGCGHSEALLELGPLTGVLGKLAVRAPYWCIREDKLVAPVRGRFGGDPEEARRAAGDTIREQNIPLDLVLELLTVDRPPRCPSCREPLTDSPFGQAVAAAAATLGDAGSKAMSSSSCPRCRESRLVLERK